MLVLPRLQEWGCAADGRGVEPSLAHAGSEQEAALGRITRLGRLLAADIPISALTLVDADLRIRFLAGSTWEPHGFDPDALAGQPLEVILPPEVAPDILAHYRAVLAGETRRFTVPYGAGYRTTLLPVVADDGQVAGCLAFAWDETAELRAERVASAELTRRLAQQSAVARLGELALRRPPVDALMDAACTAVADGLGVDSVYVVEPAGEGGLMRVRAGCGWPDGFVGSTFEMRSFARPQERARYVRGPVVIADLPNDPSWRARPLREHGVVSSATVALGRSEAPIGLLGAHQHTLREFSAQDLDFLSAISHVLAGAIDGHRVEQQIRHDALHDALTGLPNRTLLLERLRAALAAADRTGERLALFFLDVDHLKVLNDSLGHHAGDELLAAIGPRLRAVLRPTDTIARFGGDEFAVLCETVPDEAHALRVADRLVRAFAQPFEVSGEPRFCSTSVGVVVSDPAGARGPEELLSDADAALYRAKERGRGRHEVFDGGLRERMTARLRVEADLRRALEAGDQLWVAYQPFYRLPDRTLAGVEALLRWEHPERGPIEPSAFIPVAEDSGLIVELGEYVLRTAAALIARLQCEADRPDLRVTVNVSARQMALSGMPGTVGAVLRETGLPAGTLGLEITEGLLLDETPATLETLQALRRLGVRLMLDDFGTGYSSLGYLRRYPLEVIKVDRSFVHDLGADGRGDGAIVEAILGMAAALGKSVVAEGVETEGQLARLVALGCDYAQGFGLARPLPAEALEALLRA
jgi:diguanylate cyclase (GGDEF)-like protein